ncbi:MAG TPA: hypothetical protein VEX63_07295, partial [Flavisolibacter sp.]|nr:hypothetical protein [Flavisolibacter sp.]
NTKEEVSYLKDRLDQLKKQNDEKSQEGQEVRKRLREISRERGEKARKSGGIFPSSMRGFVEAERHAQQRLEGRSKAYSATTNRHANIEEMKNRNVELVYQIVGGKDYDSIDDLEKDIIEQLKIADDLLGVQSS